MFVICNETTGVPIRVWLENREDLEQNCLEQAYRLSRLPFVHKWVSLMPDTHAGMGMPIGGVLAADGVLVPNAVGVDIGCGMAFVSANLRAQDLREAMTGSGSLLQAMVGDILRNVPTGFSHHKTAQPCYTMDRAASELEKYEADGELLGLLDAGYFQVGTLGGGNHFIELQEDDDGFLGIMIHSGSRNIGKSVCGYFHNIARERNRSYYSEVPDEYRLAFLPAESGEGRRYRAWMELAMEFARENREKMMLTVKAVVEKYAGKYLGAAVEYSHEVNCHHNYAALEQHYGKEVWVHRKGATRAQNGEIAVIPGAMGSYSYVVAGLGNPESFCSSSHGAGRRYSRKGAMEAFSCERVILDLKERGVVLGKQRHADVAEESRFAYKDIDRVMADQVDLVRPVKRLKTIGVVKG